MDEKGNRMNKITVRQAAAVAGWLLKYEAAKTGGIAQTMVALGDLAQMVDKEFTGYELIGGGTASSKTLPDFMRAMVQLMHDVADANKGLGDEFVASASEFSNMLEGMNPKADLAPA